ncbi:MAG: BlaI/MecI/CopY family transcriptional regulator [Planctomycetaceae bacterium]|nr:BlaI/MecI/CopY family transcriptional regulator [Planctomycetaceae bacterium]
MSSYHLTRCEMEVMDVVWQQGRVTVQDVVDGLERPLAYTTVMTTLRILESKRGVLRREKQGRAYAYEPTVTREEVSRGVALELKELLFGGSMKSLVLNLLSSDDLTPEDVDELKRAIRSLEDGE